MKHFKFRSVEAVKDACQKSNEKVAPYVRRKTVKGIYKKEST